MAASSPVLVAPGDGHPVFVDHHVPGRMRIRIPRAAGRSALLDRYTAAFARMTEVREVSCNPATGCIVLYYDKDLEENISAILGQRCAQEHLSLQPQRRNDPGEDAADAAARAALLSGHSELALNTMAFFNGLDFEIRSVSGNSIDLNIALVGSLAVFTFMGIGAAASTPMWVTLALFGINHAVRLQSEGLAAAPAPADPD